MEEEEEERGRRRKKRRQRSGRPLNWLHKLKSTETTGCTGRRVHGKKPAVSEWNTDSTAPLPAAAARADRGIYIHAHIPSTTHKYQKIILSKSRLNSFFFFFSKNQNIAVGVRPSDGSKLA